MKHQTVGGTTRGVSASPAALIQAYDAPWTEIKTKFVCFGQKYKMRFLLEQPPRKPQCQSTDSIAAEHSLQFGNTISVDPSRKRALILFRECLRSLENLYLLGTSSRPNVTYPDALCESILSFSQASLPVGFTWVVFLSIASRVLHDVSKNIFLSSRERRESSALHSKALLLLY